MRRRILLSMLGLALISCSNEQADDPNGKYSVDIPTICHRGYHVKEVENTERAFIEAGKRNFIGIETDIRFTKDNKIICNHDDTIKGMSKTISESNYEEIMTVDISSNQSNVHVCNFSEYLETCKEYKKIPVIEFKTNEAIANCNSVISIVKESYGDIDNVYFISFGREVLRNLQSLKETNSYKYKLFRLTQSDTAINEAIEDKMNVSSKWDILNEEKVAKIKEAGLEVAAWTSNNVKNINKLKEIGVEIVTTDYIECDHKCITKKRINRNIIGKSWLNYIQFIYEG